MEIKKNDVFFTTIEDMSDDGAGIGKTDGYTWFIKDTVIGDVVEAAAAREELERLLPIQANLIDCIQRSQSA